MERSNTETDIKDRKEFAKGIVVAFNQLLKSAYDQNQPDHFRDFVGTASSLFDFYLSHNQDVELSILESASDVSH